MVAYVNDFWVLVVIAVLLLPLIMMLRKPKARRGGAPEPVVEVGA
jgi:hypothetical protein